MWAFVKVRMGRLIFTMSCLNEKNQLAVFYSEVNMCIVQIARILTYSCYEVGQLVHVFLKGVANSSNQKLLNSFEDWF